MSTAALVLAASQDDRLAAGTPPAFCLLDSVPLLVHALRAVAAVGADPLVAVVPPGYRAEAEQAVDRWLPGVRVVLVTGPADPHQSLHAGMALAAAEVVVVHEVTRPLAPAGLAGAVLSAVENGADLAVPVLDVVETVKVVGPAGQVRGTVPREDLHHLQFPRAVRRSAYLSAHAGCGQDPPRGPVQLAGAGAGTVLVPGDGAAFPLRDPGDLAVAHVMLAVHDLSG